MTGARRDRLLAGRLLGVLGQLAGIGLLLTSGWLIVRAAEQPPVLYLMVAIVSVRFFGISRTLLRYLERLLTHDAAFAHVTIARIAVYRDLDRIAPRGMSGRRRGDLVSRVVSDVDAVQDRLLRLRGPWFVAVSSASVVVVLVGVLDLTSGILVAATTVTSMAAVRLVVPWGVRRSGEQAAHGRGQLAAEASQAVLAAPDLVAHGATHLLGDAARRAATGLAAGQRRAAVVEGLGQAMVLILSGLAVAGIAAASGGLSPVVVGVLVLAPLALIEPLEALADAERLRPAIQAAERRLDELAEAPSSIQEPLDPVQVPTGFDLEVEDLAIGWTSTLQRGISFSVPEGGSLGICGPSGSGKSTLAHTLVRLLEPRAGAIRLGGVDHQRIASADVRARIGYLAQDEIVFDTTIRENLRVAAPDAADADMHGALSAAGLAAFVDSLPDGLDTRVGERGNRLSGGERQRLCLARLLLGGHRVLVVDEPTEHLDEAAGDALMADLRALTPTRSLVVISHSARVLARLDDVVSVAPRPPVAHRIAV